MHPAAGRFLYVLLAMVHLWLAIAAGWLWKRSLAADLFDFDEELAEHTLPIARYLAAFYIFIAFTMLWLTLDEDVPHFVKTTIVGWVAAVGVAGGIVANKKVALAQGLPAAITFAALWFGFI